METVISLLISAQIERYIVNPPEIKLSLWSGDVVLHNVDLRVDALAPLLFGQQQHRSHAVQLARAFVRELRIRVPLTALASQPVVVSLDSVELSFVATPTAAAAAAGDDAAVSSDDATDADELPMVDLLRPTTPPAPPAAAVALSASGSSWASSSLMRKVLANVTLVLTNLIVKYVDDDLHARASIFCRSVRLQSAATSQWRAMLVPPGHSSLLQKVLTVDDLSVVVESTALTAAPTRRVAAPPVLERLSFEARLQSVGDKRVATAVDVRVSQLRVALTLEHFSLVHQMCARLLQRTPQSESSAVAAVQLEQVLAPASAAESAKPAPQSWSSWAWDVVMPSPGASGATAAATIATSTSTAAATATTSGSPTKTLRSHSISLFVERADLLVFAHTASAATPSRATDDAVPLEAAFLEQHHRRAMPGGDVPRPATPSALFDPFGGVPLLMHANVSLLTLRRQTIATSERKVRRWFVGVQALSLRSTSTRDNRAVDIVGTAGADDLDDAARELAVRAQLQHSLFGVGTTVYADGDDLPLPDASAAAHLLGVDGLRAIDVFAEVAVPPIACTFLRLSWQTGDDAVLDCTFGRADRVLTVRFDSDVIAPFWRSCVLDIAALYGHARRGLGARRVAGSLRAHVRCGAIELCAQSWAADGAASLLRVSCDGVSAVPDPSDGAKSVLRVDRLQAVTLARDDVPAEALLTASDGQPLTLAATIDGNLRLSCDDGGAGVVLSLTPTQCAVFARISNAWALRDDAPARALPASSLRVSLRRWAVRGGRSDFRVDVDALSIALDDRPPLVAVDSVLCQQRDGVMHCTLSAIQSRVDLRTALPWLDFWRGVVPAASRSSASAVNGSWPFALNVARVAGELIADDACRVTLLCGDGVCVAATSLVSVPFFRLTLGDDGSPPLVDARGVELQLGVEPALSIATLAATVHDRDMPVVLVLHAAVAPMFVARRAAVAPARASAFALNIGAIDFECVPDRGAALPERYAARVRRLLFKSSRMLEVGSIEIDGDRARLLRWSPAGASALSVLWASDGVRVKAAPLSGIFCASMLLHCARIVGACASLLPARSPHTNGPNRRLASVDVGAVALEVSASAAALFALHISVASVRVAERDVRVNVVTVQWQRGTGERRTVLPSTSVHGSCADGGVFSAAPAVAVTLTPLAVELLLHVEKLVRRARKVIAEARRSTVAAAPTARLFAWRLVADDVRLTLCDDCAGSVFGLSVDLRGVALEGADGGGVRVEVGGLSGSASSDNAVAPLLHVVRAPQSRSALLLATYAPALNDLTIDVDSSASLSVRVGLLALGVAARVSHVDAEAAVASRNTARDVRDAIARCYLPFVRTAESAGVRVRVLAGTVAVELHDTRASLRLTASQFFALRASHDARPSRDDSVSLQTSFTGVKAVWLEGDAATPLAGVFDANIALAHGPRGTRIDVSVSALALRFDVENALRLMQSAVSFVDAVLGAFALPASLERAPAVPSQPVTESLRALRWPSAAERADFAHLVDFDVAPPSDVGGIGAELSDVDDDSRASVARQRARRSTHETRTRRTKPARGAVLVDVAAHESDACVWVAFRLSERRVLHEVRLAAAAADCDMRFELLACERWDSLQRCFAPLDATRSERSALRVAAIGGSRLAASSYRLLCRVVSTAGFVTVDADAVRVALARSDVQVRCESQPMLSYTLRLSVVGASLTLAIDDERARTRWLKAACAASSPMPPRAAVFGADDVALLSAVFVAPALRVRKQRCLPLDSRSGVAVTCARGRVDVHVNRRVRSLAMFEHVSATLGAVVVAAVDDASACASVWRAAIRCSAVAWTVDPLAVARIADAAALLRRSAPSSMADARQAVRALLPFSALVVNATNVAFELRAGVNVAEVEPHAFAPLVWSSHAALGATLQLRARVVAAAADAFVASIDVSSSGYVRAAFAFGDVWLHVTRGERSTARAPRFVLTVLGSHVIVNETGVALDFALQSATALTGFASNLRPLPPLARSDCAALGGDAVHAAAFVASVRGVVVPNGGGSHACKMLLRACGAWDWSDGVALRDEAGDASVLVDCDTRLSSGSTGAMSLSAAQQLPARIAVHVHVTQPSADAPFVVQLLPSLSVVNRTPWRLRCRVRLSHSSDAAIAAVDPGARAALPCGATADASALLSFSAWIDDYGGAAAADEAAGCVLPLVDDNWALFSVPGETTPHCVRLHTTLIAADAWQCVVSTPTIVLNRTALRLQARDESTPGAPALSLAAAPREQLGVGFPLIRVDGMPPPQLLLGLTHDRTGVVQWAPSPVGVQLGALAVVALGAPNATQGVVVVTCSEGPAPNHTCVEVSGWLVVFNCTPVPLSVLVGGGAAMRVEPGATAHCTSGALSHAVTLAAAPQFEDDEDETETQRGAAGVTVRLVARDEPLRVVMGAHALLVAVSTRAPSSSVLLHVSVDERPPLSVRNCLERDLWFRIVDDECPSSDAVHVPPRARRPVHLPASARDSAVALLHDDGAPRAADSGDDEVARVRNAVAVAASASSVRPLLASVGLRTAGGGVDWSTDFAARLPGRWNVSLTVDGAEHLLRVRVLFDGASRVVVVERADLASESRAHADGETQFAIAAQCDLFTAALLDGGDRELLVAALDEIETVAARLAPGVSVAAALGSDAFPVQQDARFCAAPRLVHAAFSAAACEVGVHDNRVEQGVLARAERPLSVVASATATDVVCCRVQLPPMVLAVEDVVWQQHLRPLQRLFSAALSNVAAAQAPTAAQAPAAYVHQLSVSSVDALVSARTREPVAVAFQRFPLLLGAVELHAVRVRAAPLLRVALQHYAHDLFQSAPAVVGTIDLLGNPTGLLREVSAGVRDAVLLPLDGVRRLSPSGFAVGLVRGVGSLVQHVAIGSFASISALSLGVARNLDPPVAADGAHGDGRDSSDERAPSEEPHNSGPLMGLVRGVTGLVSEPVRGARDGGVGGAAAGLVRGVLGVAARPIGGLFEWVGLASSDALSSVGGERAQRPRRVPVAPWRSSTAHFGALLAQAAQLRDDEPLLLVAGARLVSTAAHSEVQCALLASARRLFIVQQTSGANDEALLHAVDIARLRIPRCAPAGALVRLHVDGDAHPIELRAAHTVAAVAAHANDVDLDEFVRELGVLQRRLAQAADVGRDAEVKVGAV
jgi:hypothetical protein